VQPPGLFEVSDWPPDSSRRLRARRPPYHSVPRRSPPRPGTLAHSLLPDGGPPRRPQPAARQAASSIPPPPGPWLQEPVMPRFPGCTHHDV